MFFWRQECHQIYVWESKVTTAIACRFPVPPIPSADKLAAAQGGVGLALTKPRRTHMHG